MKDRKRERNIERERKRKKPQIIFSFFSFLSHSDVLLEQLTPKANCTGQYFDYFHCIDHCAAPKIWSQLK
jgi:ubiquinol-cytochrome c reductase subunit 6